ncbi:uncharacterized protein LOC143276644 [Babylonia areolata]|uniref:uncharacterized protein LOC143276644 n=1 Tax=Babylonia areolata TaxID=304850 RepID=UPI003FCF2381
MATCDDVLSIKEERCEMCDSDSPALYWCQECQQRVCRGCRSVHDKIPDLKDHVVHPLNLSSQHTSRREGTAEERQRAWERLRHMAETARLQIQALENSVRQLSRGERKLARERQEVTDGVNARYDDILRWVNRSRADLLDSIEARSEATRTRMTEDEDRAKCSLENLSRLVSVVSNLPDPNTDVFALEDEFQGVLLKNDVHDYFRRLGDAEEHKTFLRLTSDPSALDPEAVGSYLGELTSSGKAVSSKSLAAEVRQARELTTDLEKRLTATENSFQLALQALQAKQDSTDTLAKDAKTDLRAAEARLDKVQTRVAFHVWHKTNPLSTAANGILVLDHAIVNVGNAYNPSTGIFTAPVSGLYCLHASIMVHASQVKMAYAGLFIDNVVHGTAVSDGRHSCFDQATIRAVVPMKQGQTAYLKNIGNTANYYVDQGQPYSSFSGYLVQAD